jgi:hypothetical protein
LDAGLQAFHIPTRTPELNSNVSELLTHTSQEFQMKFLRTLIDTLLDYRKHKLEIRRSGKLGS